MKRILFFSGLILMIFLHIRGALSVHGGSNAILGQFPAQVAIDFPNNTLCGGTIINQNHILTAASCAINSQHHLVPFNQVLIRAGLLTLVDNATRINVVAIFIHPRFNPITNENDIAVVRTVARLNFNPNETSPAIAIAQLQERIVPDNDNCIISGWHRTIGNSQPHLQFLTVPIRNRDTVCNSHINHNGRLLDSMLCAGGVRNLLGNVCPSTRGGALYCNNYVTGVLSFGTDCGPPNRPGAYTQVRMYRDWILQQFNNTNIPRPGILQIPGSSSSAGVLSTHFIVVFFGVIISKILLS